MYKFGLLNSILIIIMYYNITLYIKVDHARKAINYRYRWSGISLFKYSITSSLE